MGAAPIACRPGCCVATCGRERRHPARRRTDPNKGARARAGGPGPTTGIPRYPGYAKVASEFMYESRSDGCTSDRDISDGCTSDSGISDGCTSDKSLTDGRTSDRIISDGCTSDRRHTDGCTSDRGITDRCTLERDLTDRCTPIGALQLDRAGCRQNRTLTNVCTSDVREAQMYTLCGVHPSVSPLSEVHTLFCVHFGDLN